MSASVANSSLSSPAPATYTKAPPASTVKSVPASLVTVILVNVDSIPVAVNAWSPDIVKLVSELNPAISSNTLVTLSVAATPLIPVVPVELIVTVSKPSTTKAVKSISEPAVLWLSSTVNVSSVAVPL